MTKEDTIIIPRWFLEVVEDTLRIQNNINLDEKNGETCQDRNVRQSLNGVRKLLNGEELTGMERLEKLQPLLPSNLDEAAKEYMKKARKHLFDDSPIGRADDAFKAGAEWMAEQGETIGTFIEKITNDEEEFLGILVAADTFKEGDKVIVQIRKK